MLPSSGNFILHQLFFHLSSSTSVFVACTSNIYWGCIFYSLFNLLIYSLSNIIYTHYLIHANYSEICISTWGSNIQSLQTFKPGKSSSHLKVNNSKIKVIIFISTNPVLLSLVFLVIINGINTIYLPKPEKNGHYPLPFVSYTSFL